ncbi:MAG: hypothetical protein EX285_05725 [Thaumarchaeota archaeon]|nr:hypothetical protein [Nitrososphaerota archaeon]
MRDAGFSTHVRKRRPFEPALLAWEANILTARPIPHKYVNETSTLLILSVSGIHDIGTNVR